MNKITFPIKSGMQGPAVGNLQDALLLLLERGVVLRDNAGLRQELTTAVQRERVGQVYEGATRKLVSIFQEEQHLAVVPISYE